MTHAEVVYQHLKQLPESVAAEVSAFVRFPEQSPDPADSGLPRQPGSAKGLVWMADDFDAALGGFKGYQ